MATSNVVTAITDLPYQSSSSSSSLSSNLADLSKIAPSMSLDDLLKFINPPFEPEPGSAANARSDAVGSIPRQGSSSLPTEMAARTVDEVWKGIVEGSDQMPVGSGVEGREEEVTLEDFLTEAGAVREEDVRGLPVVAVGADGEGHWAVAAAFNGIGAGFPALPVQAFENGIEGPVGPVVGGLAAESSRRGKRRVQEAPMDRASLQKQRRMIKNRESAARSRERKQAYTSELEAMVAQLEEENAELKKKEVERNNKRVKQLMEYLIPVVEKKCSCRSRSVHRRVNSAQW